MGKEEEEYDWYLNNNHVVTLHPSKPCLLLLLSLSFPKSHEVLSRPALAAEKVSTPLVMEAVKRTTQSWWQLCQEDEGDGQRGKDPKPQGEETAGAKMGASSWLPLCLTVQWSCGSKILPLRKLPCVFM